MTGTRFEMGATKEHPILVLQQKVRLDTKVLRALRNYEKSIYKVTSRRLFDTTHTFKHQNITGIVLWAIIQGTLF